MKKILVYILIAVCMLNVGCVSGVSSRHLENIVATEQLILNEIKDLKSNQLTQIIEDTGDIKDSAAQSDVKLDKLLEDKAIGEVDPEGQVEVRVYIIGDKWKVWRYCTNIADAISFLEQYK